MTLFFGITSCLYFAQGRLPSIFLAAFAASWVRETTPRPHVVSDYMPQAFAAARERRLGEFKWRGNRSHTRRPDDDTANHGGANPHTAAIRHHALRHTAAMTGIVTARIPPTSGPAPAARRAAPAGRRRSAAPRRAPCGWPRCQRKWRHHSACGAGGQRQYHQAGQQDPRQH